MPIIHGRKLIVKVNGTAIAAAKTCELGIDSETIEVSSPTQGLYKEYIAGRKSWSVSTGHLVMEIPGNAALVGTTVTLSLCVNNDVVLTGDAIVRSFDVSGTIGSLCSGRFAFTGTGPLEEPE